MDALRIAVESDGKTFSGTPISADIQWGGVLEVNVLSTYYDILHKAFLNNENITIKVGRNFNICRVVSCENQDRENEASAIFKLERVES